MKNSIFLKYDFSTGLYIPTLEDQEFLASLGWKGTFFFTLPEHKRRGISVISTLKNFIAPIKIYIEEEGTPTYEYI